METRVVSSEMNGHLVPAASIESGVPCIPKTKGKVAAIVAGEVTRNVGVMLIEQPGTSTRLLDLDRSIPGMTGHFVDDLIVSIHSVAPSRFYFATMGLTGSVAIFDEVFTVVPSRIVKLEATAIRYAHSSESVDPDTGEADSVLWVVPEDLRSVQYYRTRDIGLAEDGASLSLMAV